MSGSDDLRQKVDALAAADARFGKHGRILSEGGLPSPVEAVLTEVGETVLARDLTFYIGEDGAFTLIVSGRRVLAVRSVDGLVMPNVAKQLVGKPISASADGTQRALMALLMQVDLLKEPVEVTSDAGAPFNAPAGTGLSAEKLAGLLGVAYPVVPPTRFDRFRAALDPEPAAYATIPADGEPLRVGDEDSLSRIDRTVSALGLDRGAADAAPKLSIIGQQSGSASLIGAVSDKSGSFLWTIESADIGGAIKAFHKMFDS